MSAIEALQTIRSQFEAASHQSPCIQNLVAFVQDNPDVSSNNREQLLYFDRRNDRLLRGGYLSLVEPHVSATGIVPGIVWSYRLESQDKSNASGGASRFMDLAAHAWRVLESTCPEIIHHAKCPHRDSEDAGVASRVWLGDYWRFFKRDEILQQYEDMRSHGHDIDYDLLYVPREDEWLLVGVADRHPEHLWTWFVHNLAWAAGDRMPLRARRFTWHNRVQFTFHEIDELRSFGGFPDGKKLRLPLDWFGSELEGGVFLNSVWAIDEIIRLLSNSSAGQSTSVGVRKIDWSKLDSESFERLIFSILDASEDYENPEWLTTTNAPDRGRDISAYKITRDSLGHTRRFRVIIQCKHWQATSVSPTDVERAIAQRTLWGDPPVDELIIATSGRFTDPAVQVVENRNAGSERLHIRMWPDSELERILATRPELHPELVKD